MKKEEQSDQWVDSLQERVQSLCRFCGSPMKPKGVRKRLGEYDHACGCPYHRHGNYCPESMRRKAAKG